MKIREIMVWLIRCKHPEFSCSHSFHRSINSKSDIDMGTQDACSGREVSFIYRPPINQLKDNHGEFKYLESQSDVPERR